MGTSFTFFTPAFDCTQKTMCFLFDILGMLYSIQYCRGLIKQHSILVLLECSITLRSVLNYEVQWEFIFVSSYSSFWDQLRMRVDFSEFLIKYFLVKFQSSIFPCPSFKMLLCYQILTVTKW